MGRGAQAAPAWAGSGRAPGPDNDASRRGGRAERGSFKPPRAPRYGLGGTQVEGRQAVRELLIAGTRKIQEIHIAADMEPAPILDDIWTLARDMRVLVREVSKRALDSESGTESSQGVIARASELVPVELDTLLAPTATSAPPFLVALDGVTDPRNLGAVLRTAECTGVGGVILPRHRAVHVTPTVTKTAAGAIEYLPMAMVGGLPAAIESMRSKGVWVVGLDMDGDSSVFDLAVADGPVCLVLGAEGRGLARLVRARCDVVASIPMLGNLASLNVGTAAAVALYEVARRRRAAPETA